MQTKHLFTLAVLGTALLPVSAHADGNKNTMTRDRVGAADAMVTTMDVGEFRGRLGDLQDYLSRMQENSRLARAASDLQVASMYQQRNRRLLHMALGVTEEITANWRRIDTPYTNVEQMGSRDMARFAVESDDTAFVRNAVWQIQSHLLAMKLNGRDVVVTNEMMDLIRAATDRANRADFRVVRDTSDYRQIRLSEIQWRDLGEATVSTPAADEAVVVAPERREWREVTIEHENLPDRTRVAQVDTTMEETVYEETVTTERMGTADLPQTGGNPAMLLLLGSSLMGAGGFLLRRRR